MTSIIQFHAISGAMSDTPPCFLLKIDEFRILLDCGWDETFDMTYMTRLEKYVDKIDLVLLSHPDFNHLGGLPYLISKCKLACPVYATVPVFKMGQMSLYDVFLSKNNSEDFTLFNLDDIDSAIDKIIQLEYKHTINLKGKGTGISIMAIQAGHMLGGTAWKISKVGEDDIYYSIDHNNKKERLLNGCNLESIERPSVFITTALNALYAQQKRRALDEILLSVLGQTLRSGGNSLIAVDGAGRVLELLLLLDQMWKMKDFGLAPYSLVFLNHVAFNVVEFAKTLIDWMSEKLQKTFESSGGLKNPLNFRNVILCHTLVELSQVPSPKVVLTSSPDLESGFSRDLFMQWCQDPKSSVILTCRTSPGTLARRLIDDFNAHKNVELEVRQKVKLQGRELEEFHLQKLKDASRQRIEILEDSDDEIEFRRPKLKKGDKEYSQDEDYGKPVSLEELGLTQFSFRSTTDSPASPPPTPPVEETPTKTTRFKQTFAINCQLHFIDFEGRSDAEAVFEIIKHMQPQKLIIVRGSPQSVLSLRAITSQVLPDSQIFTPAIEQIVDLTSGKELYQVKLTEPLMSSLSFKKVKDSELAWVDGSLNFENDENKEITNPQEFSLPSVPVPSVQPVAPYSEEEIKPSRPAIFVNKLKLTDFKQLLINAGIECQIVREVLRISSSSGRVSIRKRDHGRKFSIEVFGIPDNYYQIRSLLYEQFAIL